METIWLSKPGVEPIEVEYVTEKIVPLMVKGYSQIPNPHQAAQAPAQEQEKG